MGILTQEAINKHALLQILIEITDVADQISITKNALGGWDVSYPELYVPKASQAQPNQPA